MLYNLWHALDLLSSSSKIKAFIFWIFVVCWKACSNRFFFPLGQFLENKWSYKQIFFLIHLLHMTFFFFFFSFYCLSFLVLLSFHFIFFFHHSTESEKLNLQNSGAQINQTKIHPSKKASKKKLPKQTQTKKHSYSCGIYIFFSQETHAQSCSLYIKGRHSQGRKCSGHTLVTTLLVCGWNQVACWPTGVKGLAQGMVSATFKFLVCARTAQINN